MSKKRVVWKKKDYSRDAYIGYMYPEAPSIHWNKIEKMFRYRRGHASVVFQDKLWVFGGHLDYKEHARGRFATNETEILDLKAADLQKAKWQKGPRMPVALWGHSVIADEKNQVVIILGGCIDGRGTSDKVFIMDKNHVFHEVGSMRNFRYYS